jgi:hypothetical protein
MLHLLLQTYKVEFWRKNVIMQVSLGGETKVFWRPFFFSKGESERPLSPTSSPLSSPFSSLLPQDNIMQECHKRGVTKLVSCLSTCIFPDKVRKSGGGDREREVSRIALQARR